LDDSTVRIADCSIEFVELPADNARMGRTKETIIRTSILISSGTWDVEGPVIRIVNDKASGGFQSP
jgi:hypothetical protein